MIIEKKVKELVFAEYNPRQVSKTAIDRLKKSLSSPQGKELFKRRPILVNQREGKLVVYAGNMRLRAAMALGMTEVPCIVDAITLEEEKERNVKDNLVIGEWDDDLLANNFDLQELEDWGMDLKELGIEPIGDEETDEVPEPPKEARAERGKIYQLGKHRVMCGDSTNAGDVALLMDGNKADMVFTDPPYNVSFNGRSGKHEVIKNDDLPNEDFIEFIKQIASVITLIDPKVYYIWCNWKFYGVLQELLPYKACIVWAKNVFGMGNGYRHQHEFCMFNGKIDENIKNESDLWQVKKDSNYVHPTQKPVELSVRAFSNHIKLLNVLDLFGGSGSTLIGAEQTGRNAFLMEIDPRYVDVIIERYCNYAKCDKEEIYDSAVQMVQENASVEKG